MTANMVGHLTYMTYNQFGEEMSERSLQEVTHCLSMTCNVLNITKLLLEGRIFGRNKDAIWLKKNRKRIIFDIKLNTKRGVIFCVHSKRFRILMNINTAVLKIDSGKTHRLA